MTDKVFGLDFTNDTAPQSTWTISINTGSELKDVSLGDMHNGMNSLLKQPGNGGAKNYTIVPSIASNNLTVAIKTGSGNDASASDPIYANIEGLTRTITGSLSVTVNAGTNTFNAGSTELKTNAVDFFVYLGYRVASATVFVIISRIPYARTYADFSATATNQKYGAYSGSAPAGTDVVINIGRFRAQNSGTASYNWSIASSVVVNQPIFDTDWLSWTPVLSPTGGALTSYAINSAKYRLLGSMVNYYFDATMTNNGTGNGYLQITYPWTPTNIELGTGFNQGTFAIMQLYSTYIMAVPAAYPVASGNSFIGQSICRIN